MGTTSIWTSLCTWGTCNEVHKFHPSANYFVCFCVPPVQLPKIYTIISVNSDEHFLMGQKNTNHKKILYNMVKNVIQGYILGAKVFTEIATLYFTKFTQNSVKIGLHIFHIKLSDSLSFQWKCCQFLLFLPIFHNILKGP